MKKLHLIKQVEGINKNFKNCYIVFLNPSEYQNSE